MDSTAFSNVVTALTNALNTDAMFTNLAALIPVVGGVLIFAFTLIFSIVWLVSDYKNNKSCEFGGTLIYKTIPSQV